MQAFNLALTVDIIYVDLRICRQNGNKCGHLAYVDPNTAKPSPAKGVAGVGAESAEGRPEHNTVMDLHRKLWLFIREIGHHRFKCHEDTS